MGRPTELGAVAAGAAALLLASVGQAADVAYEFKAKVVQVTAPGAVPEGFPAVGGTLSGRFRYDPGHQGQVSDSIARYRFRPPIHVIDVDLPFEPPLSFGDLNIRIARAHEKSSHPWAHILKLGSEMRAQGMAWPYGVTRVLVHLMLTDARAKALPSFDLPEKIELADFTEADVRVMGSWPPGGETEAGPTWTIHGKIESLEPLALETPEK